MRLEAEGRIIRLKKGLYVAAVGEHLSLELAANHLYGPSYVSMSSALRWHGLIPERVVLVQSVTTKHTRNFSTPLGDFHYQCCSAEYFPIGVSLQGQGNVRFLMATPEKALCDYIKVGSINSFQAILDGLSSRLLCRTRAHSGLCNVAQGERRDCLQVLPNPSNILIFSKPRDKQQDADKTPKALKSLIFPIII